MLGLRESEVPSASVDLYGRSAAQGGVREGGSNGRAEKSASAGADFSLNNAGDMSLCSAGADFSLYNDSPDEFECSSTEDLLQLGDSMRGTAFGVITTTTTTSSSSSAAAN